MEIWKAGILGLVQGFTEFLPVSSSGHLVIARHLLGLAGEALAFDVLVHFGTLLAVVVSFWRTIWAMLASAAALPSTGAAAERGAEGLARPDARTLLVGIAVATVPAALAGVLLKDRLEPLFASVTTVGLCLVATGLLLAAGDAVTARRRRARQASRAAPGKGWDGAQQKVTLWRASVVGLAQALALVPGLSRSGLTISVGRMTGLAADRAAEFSFLAAIPVIAGAAAVEVADLAGPAAAVQRSVLSGPAALTLGVLTSFFSGCVAIRLVMGLSRRERLMPFAVYCFVVGVASATMGLAT